MASQHASQAKLRRAADTQQPTEAQRQIALINDAAKADEADDLVRALTVEARRMRSCDEGVRKAAQHDFAALIQGARA